MWNGVVITPLERLYDPSLYERKPGEDGDDDEGEVEAEVEAEAEIEEPEVEGEELVLNKDESMAELEDEKPCIETLKAMQE